jgi:hypothetical protein
MNVEVGHSLARYFSLVDPNIETLCVLLGQSILDNLQNLLQLGELGYSQVAHPGNVTSRDNQGMPHVDGVFVLDGKERRSTGSDGSSTSFAQPTE